MLGGNEHVADNMNDSIPGYTVCNADGSESVDIYADQSTVARNINAQGFVFEQCWEINLSNKSMNKS